MPHITVSSYQGLHSSRTYLGLICEYQDPNKGETKYHTFLILLLFGCYILMLFIRSICLCMCSVTYIHLWKRWVIIWKLIKLMAHIYSGSCLCPGLGSGVHVTTSGDLSLRAPHDTSDIRLLLLETYHYAPHTNVSISFPHPNVSWVLYYIYSLVIMSIVNTVIQHPWLSNYEVNRSIILWV